MSKPQIFIVVKFNEPINGMRTFDTHHIAACSNTEAFDVIFEQGLDTKDMYMTNNDGHGRGESIKTIYKGKVEFDCSEDAFKLWVDTQTRPYSQDGENYPASWVRVPSKKHFKG